ncbi:MAG: hypothetical protein PHO86_00730 [Bacilli bacterium]|nr:hypothetical protein [Bacilli bacterium]
MKKYLVLLVILFIALVGTACKDNEKNLYTDGIIYECETYYKTVGSTRLDILEMTTDELGNPNSGFKYYRLVFFADRTFAFVSLPYSTGVEEIYYGTYVQKNETSNVARIGDDGKIVTDESGNIVYDEVVNSVITLYYENVNVSMEDIFGYEKYTVSLDKQTLTRKQTQYTSTYQATVNQTWKRVELKDIEN